MLYSPVDGSDPCLSPYGRDIVYNSIYESGTSLTDSSEIWILVTWWESGWRNPFCITVGYAELRGMKSDPEWYPSTSINSFIFLKKRFTGGEIGRAHV